MLVMGRRFGLAFGCPRGGLRQQDIRKQARRSKQNENNKQWFVTAFRFGWVEFKRVRILQIQPLELLGLTY